SRSQSEEATIGLKELFACRRQRTLQIACDNFPDDPREPHRCALHLLEGGDLRRIQDRDEQFLIVDHCSPFLEGIRLPTAEVTPPSAVAQLARRDAGKRWTGHQLDARRLS